MNAGELCQKEVVVIGRDDSILEAARRMRDYHVGSLIVTEKSGGNTVPVGILTDRAIVVQVISEDLKQDGINTEDLLVGDVISPHLVCVHKDADVFFVNKKMKEEGIRRIPVVDDNNSLVGILSMDDLLEFFTEELEDLSQIALRGQMREKRKFEHRLS